MCIRDSNNTLNNSIGHSTVKTGYSSEQAAQDKGKKHPHQTCAQGNTQRAQHARIQITAGSIRAKREKDIRLRRAEEMNISRNKAKQLIRISMVKETKLMLYRGILHIIFFPRYRILLLL